MTFFLLLFSATVLTGPSLNHQQEERWGQIGHYVTGKIAEQHMTDAARERVYGILGDRSIALAAVWMDDIRSDSRYDHTETWHWVTIPDHMTYDQVKDDQEEGGDLLGKLEQFISELKKGGLDEEEEREKLMMVIHMIGDIHQPLHVGTGEDRGGNNVRLQWMGEGSNLHRVWDSNIIDSFQLSYTELAEELNRAGPEQIEQWQQTPVRGWAYESMIYREDVYNLPDDMRLGYEYRYKNKEIVFKRLLQAGIRIAGVLNEIYG